VGQNRVTSTEKTICWRCMASNFTHRPQKVVGEKEKQQSAHNLSLEPSNQFVSLLGALWQRSGFVAHPGTLSWQAGLPLAPRHTALR
jgi:hypothetical protein